MALQVAEVNAHAAELGRTPRFGLNGFMIARDSEKEARETPREIIATAEAGRPCSPGASPP